MSHNKYIFILTALIVFVIFFLSDDKETLSTAIEYITPSEDVQDSKLKTASVTRVIDGDTFVAEVDSKEQRIRLLGVDAAEIDDGDDKRTTKRECYSLEARDELERLMLGGKVYLKRDPLSTDVDEYGRLLRYVFLPDESLVNDTLIRTGFTRHLSYFPITLNDQLAESEQAAQENNLGLWTTCP